MTTAPDHKLPTPGKKFPCAQCGAGLEFRPGADALECPYCGHRTPIAQSEEQVRELDFEAYFARAAVSKAVAEEMASSVHCNACGATTMMAAKIAASECAFCGAHLDNPSAPTEPAMEPGSLLPFKIESAEARARFLQWVGSLWFAPNDIKKMAQLGRIEGLYVPYWTYDAMTVSFYRGERGEHYWVTVGSGKNQRRERRTRWYPASGRIQHWFDDVLVCASKGLPPKLAQDLEPWDLGGLAPYNHDYLAGFKTERYQKDAREGFAGAQERMAESIRAMVRADIGGDEQRIHSVETAYSGITFKHVLLPVWLAAYRYHDRTFRVLVNARTGEIQGERPYSWIKIALAVVAAIIAIVAIFMIAGGDGGGNANLNVR